MFLFIVIKIAAQNYKLCAYPTRLCGQNCTLQAYPVPFRSCFGKSRGQNVDNNKVGFVVIVVPVVVYILHDNKNYLYNRASGLRCSRCRLYFAHCAQNVNFAANNVKRPGPTNRRETVGRWTKTAQSPHCIGHKNFCKRYRKSCNAYSIGRIAPPLAGQRGRFLRPKGRKFNRFNQKAVIPRC